MKRIFLMILAIGLTVGCDEKKPADTNAEPVAAEKKVEETPKEVAKADKAAPTSQGTTEEEAEKRAVLPDNLGDGETKLYGAKFTIIEAPITLASAIKKGAASEGPFKIEAKMEKVCAKKGCWFTLDGEGVDRPVRVRMKDYGFFVPRNATNAKAVVEGTLTARDVPEKEARHYAEDEGLPKAEIEKIKGSQKAYQFMATSVEVTMPPKS